MKRLFAFWVAVLGLAAATSSMASAQAQTQSLGDYARAAKKTKSPSAEKKSAKVYDNDNLPAATSISVVGDTSKSASDKKDDASQDQDKTKTGDSTAKPEDKSGDKKSEPQLKAGQSGEEREKALKAVKDKLAEQKDKISLLARELDVLQREHQLKAAEFYANTARRTQNPNGFQGDDAKYKQQIADKQKQLDDANNKLNQIQDDARKAGAPNSVIE